MGTNTSALARLRQARVVVLHTLTWLDSCLIGLTNKRDFPLPKDRRGYRERHQKSHDGISGFHQNLRKGKVMSIITIGIDLAKNVFAFHRVNESGKAELCQTQSTARPAPAADRKPAALPDWHGSLQRRKYWVNLVLTHWRSASYFSISRWVQCRMFPFGAITIEAYAV